ncbi:hypothetical protein [Nocardia arthritidis]|uniref:DUF3995 domain-containing protein n=1 Tax=Nocardia arthritidis TaxID=228602 RepID=A0A6G9Y805_9NOCA|nr:hypothetical protein [Nocardia arthritidis]QIS09250.1 hypothetical protein F5544_06695 [Nocardia arthritidis]
MLYKSADHPLFRVSPGTPRWAVIAARLVPVAALPSTLWRFGAVLGLPLGDTTNLPWWARGYVIAIMIVLEALAFLTIGLVSPWGEVVPHWVPALGGRQVRPLAVVIPALVGAVLATAGGLTFAYDCYAMLADPSSNEMGGPAQRVIFTLCYVPLAAWGPLLAAVTISYYRRRTRGGIAPAISTPAT